MEINGFENYTIDETGNIYSKYSNKFLKPSGNTYGYLQISLYKNCKLKKFLVHRLLAIEFIPNTNNYETVDHIDRNKLNNNLSNLRWASKSMQENNKNAYGEIKHKYIRYDFNKRSGNKYYLIAKTGYFKKRLNVEKYTLQDTIELRTKLLLESNLDPIPITE